MLLIVSDVMKSLWFLLYDIVSVFGHHSLESTGAFCQVSGFFISMGIEAADAAVFLMALHSTVYIFWPHRAGGESGLYPYRHMAYSFYILWPVLMASLAYVKGVPAYVNTGQSCYLPTVPWWYRTTLSWIPRYLILLIILVMYGSSYTYVRVMMRRYSRRNSEIPLRRVDRLVPQTPPLDCHGLAGCTPNSSLRSSSRVPSGGTLHRDRSPLRVNESPRLRDSFRLGLDKFYRDTRMKGTWAWTGFDSSVNMAPGHGSSPGVSPMGIGCPGTMTTEPIIWETAEAEATLQPPKLAFFKHKVPVETPCSTRLSTLRGRTSPDFYRRALGNAAENSEDHWVSRLDLGTLPNTLGRNPLLTGSQVHLVAMLRQGPLRLEADNASVSTSSPVVALDQEAFESGGISRSRGRIRRQLRLLFIYPAVYACVWIFPFVSDVSKFNNALDQHNPFWMLVVSLISLCVQGLCDTVVFCSREKPWRHMRGGFWETFGLDFLTGWKFSTRKNSGRTREEMFNDGQHARSRREEELDRENEFRGSPGGRMLPTAGGVDWWDVEEGGKGGNGQGHGRESSQSRVQAGELKQGLGEQEIVEEMKHLEEHGGPS